MVLLVTLVVVEPNNIVHLLIVLNHLNDTAIALLKGPLNIGRRDQGGAGNASSLDMLLVGK